MYAQKETNYSFWAFFLINSNEINRNSPNLMAVKLYILKLSYTLLNNKIHIGGKNYAALYTK